MCIRDRNKWPRQHGTQGFPRLNWKDGVCSVTKLTGDQKVGKLFAIAVISNTLAGEIFFTEQLGSVEAWRDMHEVFHLLLCYWAWLKRDTYWRRGDAATKAHVTLAIRTMVSKIIDLWPRGDGNGWHITKLHEQVHVADDIERWGRHKNVHSGPQEHNHIDNVKKPAKHAQQRAETLDYQTGLRIAERHVIESAYFYVRDMAPVAEPLKASTMYATKGTIFLEMAAGIEAEPMVDGWLVWKSRHNINLGLLYQEEIMSLLIATYWDHAQITEQGTSQLQIPIFTEYHRQDTIYRAHHNYRSGGPWYDWCYVSWDDGTNLETGATVVIQGITQVVGFIEAPDGNLYAIVHPCDYDKKEAQGIIGTFWPMEYHTNSIRPKLYIVTVDSLGDSALMIPYDDSGTNFVEVWNRDKWADQFIQID